MSAASEAAWPPAAETGPALAAPAAWAEGEEVVEAGPALAGPALAASALAAPAVWAEGEEVPATGLCGCTKPTTTVAVGGLRNSCRRAACLYYPVRHCLQDLLAIYVLSKNQHPKWGKPHLLREISN
jgi:hypothetical protein